VADRQGRQCVFDGKMATPDPSRPWRYVAAVAAVGIALAIRLALVDSIGSDTPFFLFLAAVLVAAWYGGPGPGTLAAILATSAVAYYFVPGGGRLRGTLYLILFVSQAAVLLAFVESRRRALETAHRHREWLHKDVKALQQAEDRLAAQYDAARMLTEATDPVQATHTILKTCCERLAWEIGLIWNVDSSSSKLRCQDVWHRSSDKLATFAERCRPLRFGPHVDLPGRIWASGEPAWIEDLHSDPNFPRLRDAEAAGLASGCGFAIRVAGETIGVVEFFASEKRSSDPDLLHALVTIGGQIGQFIDRKRAEDALREGEARKAAILENALDAVITIDAQGRVIQFNPAAERIFGLSRETVIGQMMKDWLIPLPLRQDHIDGLARYLTTGAGPVLNCRFETTALRADGTEFPIELAITPIGSGRHVQFTGHVRDITDRKNAEVLLRTRAQELAEASRHKDEFLAMLGHELRNPLAPLRNALEVLARRGAGDPALASLRDMMKRQMEHLTRLVDDLLDVSRIDRGKIELRRSWFNLSDVMRAAADGMRPLFESNGHTFTLSLPAPDVRLFADATRVDQVFANLLNNAAKYTPRGGQIAMGAGGDDDFVAIRVRDNGIGIPAAMRDNIFNIFTQAQRLPDRVSEGLGIGLTLVRRLVELHGGTVAAESPGENQGSEFTVRLPRLAREPEMPLVLPEAVSGGGERLRLLLIDDNVDAGQTLATVLQMDGHETLFAADGGHGLELARRFRPQAVLLDIGLPHGIDGFQVARRLRQDAELRDIAILALTGFATNQDRIKAAEAGFDAYLVKPVDFDELRKELARLTRPAAALTRA
jgi:PAS domain S-box-containing protein